MKPRDFIIITSQERTKLVSSVTALYGQQMSAPLVAINNIIYLKLTTNALQKYSPTNTFTSTC